MVESKGQDEFQPPDLDGFGDDGGVPRTALEREWDDMVLDPKSFRDKYKDLFNGMQGDGPKFGPKDGAIDDKNPSDPQKDKSTDPLKDFLDPRSDKYKELLKELKEGTKSGDKKPGDSDESKAGDRTKGAPDKQTERSTNEQNEPVEAESQNDKPPADPYDRIMHPLIDYPKLREDVTPEALQPAEAVLKEAGIKNPKPHQINAVIAAEELLERPGLGRRQAIINEQGKFEAIDGMSKERKEATKHLTKFGGKKSDQYAVALYEVARRFYAFEWELHNHYNQLGINVTKAAYPKSETGGEMGSGLLALHLTGAGWAEYQLGDHKAADAHYRQARNIYEDTYRRGHGNLPAAFVNEMGHCYRSASYVKEALGLKGDSKRFDEQAERYFAEAKAIRKKDGTLQESPPPVPPAPDPPP